MRQTQVVVIPSAPEFSDSFAVFDAAVNALNQARRNARDYVTDTMLQQQQDDDEDDAPAAWSVSINCAHLHPLFGERTPAQQLQDLRDEDAAGGVVDVHYQEYQRTKLAARRSPYPTVVIEVRAAPAPDFAAPPAPRSAAAAAQPRPREAAVSLADVQRLEALFGKTAHMKEAGANASPDDAFWSAIGNSIEEVTAVTPVKLAQQWIAEHAGTASTTATFTTSSAAAVDEAYEFVFTNIAMLQETFASTNCRQQYLVLPHFLSAAATSFQKYAVEVTKLVTCLPSLRGKLSVTTYHPEHVEPSRRSPAPILVLAWIEGA